MIRMSIALASAAAFCAASGCASAPDQTGEVYQGKQYRTGSNIAVHDGDMPSQAQVVKPDTTPIFKGPGPKVGPTGGGGG